MSDLRFNLFSFSGPMRTLHISWMAFFVSFMVWFNHAPLMVYIRDTLHMSDQEVKALLILNVALTIPARIVIGMLVDRFGPRILFSVVLAVSGVLTFGFAMVNSFEQAAIMRLLLGFVGAGFVIGIRLISEWFPAKQVGVAQGVYGGWGNFGSAGAAMLLPSLAIWFGRGDDGWRYALMFTGVVAIVYAAYFYYNIRNTPRGSTYFKPKKMGAMEVSSVGDLFLYAAMNVPLYLVLGVLTWKLSPANLGLLNETVTWGVYLSLVAVLALQIWKIFHVNGAVFKAPVAQMDQYAFSQVAVLDLAYLVTFGSELALVSMLPLFYTDTFGLSTVTAGLLAAIYPVMNLIARPAGGLISDRFGRKRTLSVLFAGIAVSFVILGQVDTSWAIPLVVASTIMCGLFSKAGSGAVYAMVPLIKRRMTGQIAGMAGAYGNVGGVLFLTVLSFVDNNSFFLFIGATAAFVWLAIMAFLRDPKGHMVELMPDGSVQRIAVE